MQEVEDVLLINPQVSGENEQNDTFSNHDEKRKNLINQGFEEDLKYKKQYFDSAKGLAETWIGLSFVLTLLQFISPFDKHLQENEYIAFIVSSLGIVIGLWWQVGKCMFPEKK